MCYGKKVPLLGAFHLKNFDMAKKIYDHIEHIIHVKDKNYFNNLTQSDKNKFSVFMILKFLSMDMELTHTINYLNRFQHHLSKEQMYGFMIEMIPEKNYNIRYLTNKKNKYDNEMAEKISYLFNISDKKSVEYLKILSGDEIKLIGESLNI